jgi:hypothetical protein
MVMMLSRLGFRGRPAFGFLARALLLPIKIAMPIAPRTGEVLADLVVAVRHPATCGLCRFAGESSSQRLAAAKPSSRSREAVKDDVANFDHALQTYELRFIHLVGPSSSVS